MIEHKATAHDGLSETYLSTRSNHVCDKLAAVLFGYKVESLSKLQGDYDTVYRYAARHWYGNIVASFRHRQNSTTELNRSFVST